MLSKIKKEAKGFTIIEVMIVLLIAGLIMMIVFLAIPALQRNSRNTQRRNDVAAYLAATNEFSQNNNGKVPVAADLTTINGLAKLGILTPPTTVQTGAQNGTVAVTNMQLVTNARCDTTAIGNTVGGNSTRQVAVRFAVEGSNGSAVPQCQES